MALHKRDCAFVCALRDAQNVRLAVGLAQALAAGEVDEGDAPHALLAFHLGNNDSPCKSRLERLRAPRQRYMKHDVFHG